MAQIAGLNAMGHQVRILVARAKGLPRRYESEGVEVDAVGSFGQIMSMPMAPAFPFALRRAAMECDVLALHMPFPLNDLAVWFGLPEHVAVVLHWHAEIVGRRRKIPHLNSLIRTSISRADRIIVTDPAMITASPYLSAAREKCDAIPYGINVDYWSGLDQNQQQQARFLRNKHPRLIVSVGRLVPYKGYPVLLDAMRKVSGELIIIGEGSEHENLQSLARKLEVHDRVRFGGYLSRDQIKLHLHAARLLVLPSITEAEAFGLVQVEAMASGLPVVNTDLPTAVPNIARHNHEGLTVPPRNSVALANAINTVLDTPALAESFADSARQRANEEYSQAQFLSRLERVYVHAMRARSHAL